MHADGSIASFPARQGRVNFDKAKVPKKRTTDTRKMKLCHFRSSPGVLSLMCFSVVACLVMLDK